MVGQHNFRCGVQSVIKRMLIAGALGVSVLQVIFLLFSGLLSLCVCLIGCSNGPTSAAGRHMAEVLP